MQSSGSGGLSSSTASGGRSREWTREQPKRRSKTKGADEGREENDEDEETEEEDENGDDSESESDRGQRRRNKNRSAKRETLKREAKDNKPINTRPRRRAGTDVSYKNDDSETSSQADTDDEMNGRGGRREPNATNANSSNAEEPSAPKERNSSMTLPSLSRAAIYTNGNATTGGSGGSSGERENWGRRERGRSRSREREDNSGNGGRWNEGNNNKNDGNRREEGGSNYSGDGEGQREEEPPSPGRNEGQDVRIMFHGREIYADDLIGLRVAKTFVGHGRFLGQVVKFDEPTSLYTIVYADGDAEELSIENTIQILIQDEIERADPSIPPVSIDSAGFDGVRNERIPDSPEAGRVTPSSAGAGAVPVAPLNAPPMPSSTSHGPPASVGVPVYPPRRSPMGISEREAQFVIGLFENHAVPVLRQQGWRIQPSSNGAETRYFAPSGNFRGAGHMFASALDVVELIAFDNELLTLCFPQNVHSAILSLFPDPSASASRKRGSPAPTDMSDGYDSKRVRGARDGYGGGAGSVPMIRAGSAGPAPGRSGVHPSERMVPPVGYRPDEADRGEREAYNRERFPPTIPGRGGEPNDSYRRGPNAGASGEYLSAPIRTAPTEGGGPPSSASTSWGGPPTGQQEAGEYHHRRGYGDAPEWQDRDAMGGRGGQPSSVGSYGRPYRGEEGMRGPAGSPYYGGDRGMPRGGSAGSSGMRGSGPPPPGGGNDPASYARYRESRGGPPAPASGGQYSSSPGSFGDRYPPSRGEVPVGDYRGAPGGGSGPPPSAMADRFVRPLSRGSSGGPGAPIPGSGRGFSMMDVDRNVSGGGGGYEHHRGRSPHLEGVGPNGGYGAPPQQRYGHHQRTASNGSLPNPADDSRPM